MVVSLDILITKHYIYWSIMIYVQFGKFLTQDDARSTQSAFRLRPLVISGGSRIFQRETPPSGGVRQLIISQHFDQKEGSVPIAPSLDPPLAVIHECL